MKVVAFNGSPRKDGNTVCLINRVAAVLRSEGIDTEIVQVGGVWFTGARLASSAGPARTAPVANRMR